MRERRVTALHRPLTREAVVGAGLATAALLILVTSIRAQTVLVPLPAAMVGGLVPVTAAATAETPALLPAMQRFWVQSPTGKTAPGQTPVIELTIDPKLQQVVEAELDALINEWQATGATAIILAPARGDILALASRGSSAPSANIEERERAVHRELLAL